MIDEYKGKSGKKYFTFPFTNKMDEITTYIEELAAAKHKAQDDYGYMPGWVKGNELWFKEVVDGEKVIVITRREGR